MKVYKIAKHHKIKNYILAGLGIIFFSGITLLISIPFISIMFNIFNDNRVAFYILTALFMVLLCILLLITVVLIRIVISTYRKKIIITDDKIKFISSLKTREINFNEIEGFYLDNNSISAFLRKIVIIPINNNTNEIRFNYIFLENIEDLKSSLLIKIPNISEKSNKL